MSTARRSDLRAPQPVREARPGHDHPALRESRRRRMIRDRPTRPRAVSMIGPVGWTTKKELRRRALRDDRAPRFAGPCTATAERRYERIGPPAGFRPAAHTACISRTGSHGGLARIAAGRRRSLRRRRKSSMRMGPDERVSFAGATTAHKVSKPFEQAATAPSLVRRSFKSQRLEKRRTSREVLGAMKQSQRGEPDINSARRALVLRRAAQGA